MATKSMAMPLGWDNFFGFVCTPNHRTYRNAKHTGAFTVSYIHHNQLHVAALAVGARINKSGDKPGLAKLETFEAELIDGVFVKNANLFLECEVDRIIDGFGRNSLIAGKIVNALIDEALLNNDDVETDPLNRNPAMAYISPGRYAYISQSYKFPYPDNFKE